MPPARFWVVAPMPPRRLGRRVRPTQQRPRRSRNEHCHRHDPQRRGHREDVRDAGSDQGAAGAGEVPVPCEQPLGRRLPQPLDDQGLLCRGRRGHHSQRGVRDRRGRAGDPARQRRGSEPGRVPAARAGGLPDDVDRLRGGGAQAGAHVGRVDPDGRHGRARRARRGRRAAQRVRAHRRGVPRDRRRAGRQAPRGRGARQAALGRLRHGHERRARCRRGDDRLRLARGSWPGSRPRPRASGERTGDPAMPIELTANTDVGARLVATAEQLSEGLAARAAEHDRDGTYPFEAIDALKAAGYFAAPVPVELGGLGVSSAHDLVVASSRLARGDASVAIGVNMHLVAVHNMERRRQVAVASGAERRARGFAASLEQIARDGVVLAAAISERGQDLTRPGTIATRTESGWRIDGRKMFCTMSPAATDLYVSVTYADDKGVERYAYAMVPTDAPGVVVHDDWDALGMRASGSNSISLEGVELPESGVRGGFRAGDPLPYMERNLVAGLFHAAASLGIAESADRVARQGIAARKNGDARPRTQVADNAVDLAASRGVLSRAAALIDEHRAANPASDGSADELGALFAEAQAAKAFVGEAAARIVDRALALSGGAGYRNGSPLARAYRDVKAGSFMHPLGANRAYDYLANIALGEQPSLH